MDDPTPTLNTAAAGTALDGAVMGCVEDAIACIARVDVDAVDALAGEALLCFTAALEVLGRRVDALRVAAATTVNRLSDPVFGATGLAQSVGFRGGVEVLEQVTGCSAVTVRRRIRLGALVTSRRSETGYRLPALFPTVGDAFATGGLGVDAAEAIGRELSAAGPRAAVEALLAAERFLVGQATGHANTDTDTDTDGDTGAGTDTDTDAGTGDAGTGGTGSCVPVSADLIRGQARVWRDALDPDGIEPRAVQAKQNRDFWISRTPYEGLHTIRGRVTSDVAGSLLAVFDTVLSPRTRPMFHPDDNNDGNTGNAGNAGKFSDDGNADNGTAGNGSDDGNADTGTAGNAADDGVSPDPGGSAGSSAAVVEARTAGQKRADVFAAMVRSFLGATAFPVPPPVLVSIHGATYTTGHGTGTISGVEGGVPASVIGRIGCDAGTQPVWFTPTGRIHALGTAGRFFTTHQRRAIAARDGNTCLDPACRIPATATEAHHVTAHRHGGPTHVDNGVLLCWYHHDLADAGILTITMINGTPHITKPRWHPRT